MDKPIVRTGFTWNVDRPTTIRPLADSGGCVVAREGRDARGAPSWQIDLFVATGREGSYVKTGPEEPVLVDLPGGHFAPSVSIAGALDRRSGDPPPPHPPIGPDDLLWLRVTLQF